MTDPAGDRAAVEDALEALLAEHSPRDETYEEFRGHQFDHGLAWVDHPVGCGGLDVAPQYQAIVDQRLAGAGAEPLRIVNFFMHLAGPTIVMHGNDEQRARFLRPMFAGTEVWCQLFSEPGAGSDLAGLATRARRDGDVWRVDGQKVWNTFAHVADRGMLVARTDPAVPKHRGMTYFALDMHADGVEVRPLRQITGEAEFNEVYITDVEVPDTDRIGAVGEGWGAALTTLMNERAAISGDGGPLPMTDAIEHLLEVWHDLPAGQRPAAEADRIVQLWTEARIVGWTLARADEAAQRGIPGPQGAVGKLAGTELLQRIYDRAVGLAGLDGQVDYDFTFRRPRMLEVGVDDSDFRHRFLRARAATLEGGTSEIMRNILGEQILGLPREPRVDKDVPWRDVPRS